MCLNDSALDCYDDEDVAEVRSHKPVFKAAAGSIMVIPEGDGGGIALSDDDEPIYFELVRSEESMQTC